MTTSSPESAHPTPRTPGPESSTAAAPNQTLLEYAWERHDTYSDNASKAQKRFFFIRRVLAYLAVIIVFLAVLQPVLLSQAATLTVNGLETIKTYSLLALFGLAFEEFKWLDPTTWSTPFSWMGGLALVNFLLILLPILDAGLLAFAVKFDRGNNWVLLRGNSETLKMEIFYYRTKAKNYKRHRNAVLAEKIQLISERVKGSAVHQAALSPYEGQPQTRMQKGILILFSETLIDIIRRSFQAIWDFLLQFREVEDIPKSSGETSHQALEETPEKGRQAQFLNRYADLNADMYIRYRLEDQFNWYRRKAQMYDRDYQILQAFVYVFGGLGTLLAAIGFQNWVAVSTSLAAALAGYLEYKRVEATLVGYNQAADALYDIRAWWYSLGDEDRAKSANFEKLVTSTEETIRSEHTSWLQDMQDRLANLYGDVGDEEASEEETQAAPPPDAPSPAPTSVGGEILPPPAATPME